MPRVGVGPCSWPRNPSAPRCGRLQQGASQHRGARGSSREVGDAQSAFGYRYSAELLIRSGTKYFLVPGDWSPSDAVTIVLPDSDSRLLEFTHNEATKRSGMSIALRSRG